MRPEDVIRGLEGSIEKWEVEITGLQNKIHRARASIKDIRSDMKEGQEGIDKKIERPILNSSNKAVRKNRHAAWKILPDILSDAKKPMIVTEILSAVLSRESFSNININSLYSYLKSAERNKRICKYREARKLMIYYLPEWLDEKGKLKPEYRRVEV